MSPPVKLVLVQWDGLPLEEASWEPWDELCVLHNLEDKVIFDTGGVDSNTTTDQHSAHTTKNTTRPTRGSKKPVYLQDFV